MFEYQIFMVQDQHLKTKFCSKNKNMVTWSKPWFESDPCVILYSNSKQPEIYLESYIHKTTAQLVIKETNSCAKN